MDSRNVPTLLPKSLTSPLSVNVDNPTMPQRAGMNNVISPLDHLSPDTRKHLIGTFTDGGGGSGTMVSPSTSSMSFDAFDSYNDGGSTAGLLQVGPDLLGGLLDRGLV